MRVERHMSDREAIVKDREGMPERHEEVKGSQRSEMEASLEDIEATLEQHEAVK